MSTGPDRIPVIGALAFSLALAILFVASVLANGYVFSPPVTSICGGTHTFDTDGAIVCTGGVPAP